MLLPKNLALVDDDKKYTEILSQFLRDHGVDVDVFADSNDLLTHRDPFGYEFYVVDLMLPGIDGVDLIKLIRRRSDAGLVVVSGRLSADVFEQSLMAGADMYLSKPVQFDQLLIAIQAVRRRAAAVNTSNAPWTLDRRARQLVAPDGTRVDLSAIDLAVMECFIDANGEAVTREVLRLCLGQAPQGDPADGINATIYRLRRRIERATGSLVPLQSKSRVGYVFRAPLKAT